MTSCNWPGCWSYAFNLQKEGIDQGYLCDKHYWQSKAEESDLMFRSQRALIAMLRQEVKYLRGFAVDVLNIWSMDIDGGDIQDLAVKHGLLKETTRTEPCGEDCACSECADIGEWRDGIICYRKTEILTGE